MADKVSNIYWAPVFFDNERDWNLMYSDIDTLYNITQKEKISTEKTNNFFFCPAFQNIANKTLVLKNPMESHFLIEEKNVSVLSKNFIRPDIVHSPCIKDTKLLTYGMSFIFFSDEDLTMSLTSPFFHPAQHQKYGSIVPGKFNIGSWFRVINLEYNLWGNELRFEKDEPLAYASFETEKKIKLHRFQMTEKLQKIASTCGTSSQWEKFVPLADRYKRFKQSRTNKVVLKEIKENLVV